MSWPDKSKTNNARQAPAGGDVAPGMENSKQTINTVLDNHVAKEQFKNDKQPKNLQGQYQTRGQIADDGGYFDDELQAEKAQKIVERNITNGEVNFQPSLDALVEVKEIQHIDDTNLDWIVLTDVRGEQKRITNFIEDIKSGTFVQISDAAMQKHIESIDDDDRQVKGSWTAGSFDHEMIEIYNETNLFIFKILYFCLGGLMGYSVMHVAFLYIQSDVKQAIIVYAEFGLRLNQILFVLCFLGAAASLHFTLQTNLIVQRSRRDSSPTLQNDISAFNKSVLSSIFYIIAYGIIVLSHITVAKFNANFEQLKNETVDMVSDMQLYRIANIFITVFLVMGWITTVSNTKSPIDYSRADNTGIEDDDEDRDLTLAA